SWTWCWSCTASSARVADSTSCCPATASARPRWPSQRGKPPDAKSAHLSCTPGKPPRGRKGKGTSGVEMGRALRPRLDEALALLGAGFRNEEEPVQGVRWLAPDTRGARSRPDQERLADAVRLGQRIYRDFHAAFLEWFGGEDGPGAAEVRRRLLAWHGHADA